MEKKIKISSDFNQKGVFFLILEVNFNDWRKKKPAMMEQIPQVLGLTTAIPHPSTFSPLIQFLFKPQVNVSSKNM